MQSKYIIVFYIFSLFAGIMLGVQYPATARSVEFSAAGPERLQFIPDQENGVFRFVMDGQDVARLSADGLSISGSVEYRGTLTDLGAAAGDAPYEAEATP